MPRLHRDRGSALVLSIIMLAVLSIIGIAAVALSSQERSSAAAKARSDAIMACANAAQAKIWAELTKYGLGYLDSTTTIDAFSLPDGTKLVAPAHYGQTSGSAQVNQVVFTIPDAAGGAPAGAQDLTNGGTGSMPVPSVHRMVAHCVDKNNREYEVELAVRFAL